MNLFEKYLIISTNLSIPLYIYIYILDYMLLNFLLTFAETLFELFPKKLNLSKNVLLQIKCFINK